VSAHPYILDVRSRESSELFVQSIERSYGPIDVYVNASDLAMPGAFMSVRDREMKAMYETNVRGTMFGMKAVLPSMLERGEGRIFNIASIFGKTQRADFATYAAAQHAIVGLTASVRSELLGTGVRLTAVIPGTTGPRLPRSMPLARAIRVQPADVGAAIVRNVDQRTAELYVPGWLALYPMVQNLLPDWLNAEFRDLACGGFLESLDSDPQGNGGVWTSESWPEQPVES
jgi:NADP-dependent 3-hydroxy acid dehydrogenase YdfG